jgi:hypothetical protein
MGTCEIPNSSLYGLELLDLGLLGGDYVPRELIYLFVLSVPQRNARHSDCSLVWGTIASIKRLSEYLPFCMTICLAMSLDPMPIEPWPIWPWSILP